MPELVRGHLTEAQHGVVALEAVVVRLLLVVVAGGDVAGLRGRELLEARRVDGVPLLVLAAVRHHLVGVRAVVVALQTVEVTRALLVGAWEGGRENWVSFLCGKIKIRMR